MVLGVSVQVTVHSLESHSVAVNNAVAVNSIIHCLWVRWEPRSVALGVTGERYVLNLVQKFKVTHLTDFRQ